MEGNWKPENSLNGLPVVTAPGWASPVATSHEIVCCDEFFTCELKNFNGLLVVPAAVVAAAHEIVCCFVDKISIWF